RFYASDSERRPRSSRRDEFVTQRQKSPDLGVSRRGCWCAESLLVEAACLMGSASGWISGENKRSCACLMPIAQSPAVALFAAALHRVLLRICFARPRALAAVLLRHPVRTEDEKLLIRSENLDECEHRLVLDIFRSAGFPVHHGAFGDAQLIGQLLLGQAPGDP